MNQVEIHIDETRHEFLLRDKAGIVLENRRARYYFINELKAEARDDGSLAMQYVQDTRERLLQSIQAALQKYDILYTDSIEIQGILRDYYTENENFKQFSTKAKKIWNNEVNLEEFRLFKEVLEKRLPSRRLYDKQLLAAYHLTFSQNACNFSVPGAGKTSVVYGAYAYLNSLPADYPKHVNKLVVIGPLSSFGPWEDEYLECFGIPVNAKRLSGGVPPIEREKHLLQVGPIDQIPELTLMSYQSVQYNLENLIHFLKRFKVMLVLDEAHKIKNIEQGVWASSVLSMSKYCKARVVLTGTPAPNGYEDIYNLYEFIWPGKGIINFNASQLKAISENPYDSRADELIGNIAPFFIRIKKSDLGLPPIKEHSPMCVQMSAIQREIYDHIENHYMGYMQEHQSGQDIVSKLMKARCIRLMQAATNPGLLARPLSDFFAAQGLASDLYVDDKGVIEKILRYKEIERAPRKFEVVCDLVKEILKKNHKVIIWGTFIQNIKELRQYLSEAGIKSEELIGEVPIETDELGADVKTREKIIKAFHALDSNFKVIIANPFAVAESISLHKACHHAIYFERTFNAGNFVQSKDRIHRVGLSADIVTHYYYILSEKSIDETIHTRLIEKERRMLELIESQEIPLIGQNLDYETTQEDDIKALIRDYVKRRAKI